MIKQGQQSTAELVINTMQEEGLPILEWMGDSGGGIFYAISRRVSDSGPGLIKLRVPEFVIQQLELDGRIIPDFELPYSHSDKALMWKLAE